MNILIKKLILNCLLLTLVACSSYQDTTYYLLHPIEEAATTNTKTETFPAKEMTILVKSINFPDYLSRPQMILRENEYKLEFSEYHRWAEPLKNDFTRVFIENINTRISPSRAVVYSGLDGTKPIFQLSIKVLRMDVNTNNQATLKVKWSLLSKQRKLPMEKHNNEFIVPIDDNSHQSGVEAQSKAIGLFADQVAESIRQFSSLLIDNSENGFLETLTE